MSDVLGSGASGDADCDEVLEQLYSYLDHEVGPSVRARIEAHFGDCPPCHEVAEFEVLVRQTVSRKCREEVPVVVRERVLGLLARLDEGGPSRGTGA